MGSKRSGTAPTFAGFFRRYLNQFLVLVLAVSTLGAISVVSAPSATGAQDAECAIGSSSSCPATSPQEIYNLYGTTTDGAYWLRVNGQAKQTYLILNTSAPDGGMWFLGMKAPKGSTTFKNASTYWSDQTTTTGTSSVANDVSSDAKFDAFNYLPAKKVLAVFRDRDSFAFNSSGSGDLGSNSQFPGHTWVETLASDQTMFTRFTTNQNIVDQSGGQTSYQTRHTILRETNSSTGKLVFPYQTGWSRYGFNNTTGYVYRWGVTFNNETNYGSNDTGSGIGMADYSAAAQVSYSDNLTFGPSSSTTSGVSNPGTFIYPSGFQIWGKMSEPSLGAPTSVTASIPSAGQVNLSWGAPSGVTATDYVVQYKISTNSTYSNSFVVSGQTTASITGLSSSNSYNFRVFARTANNSTSAANVSSSTITATPRTTPTAPSITSITPGDTTLSVAFNAPSSDGGSSITNYQYSTDGGSSWRTRDSGTTASPLIINTTSAASPVTLVNGTTYNIQIRAVNIVGNGTATASSPGTPAFPNCSSPPSSNSGGFTYVAFKNVGTCNWTVPAGVTSINYLVVGGGGGGASRHAGGGGAGGLINATGVTVNGSAITITVGAGGAGGAAQSTAGTNASNGGSSSISGGGISLTTAVGGGAGSFGASAGASGGSGGGGGSSGSGGSGTVGQGSNGSAGATNGSSYWVGGGGGGAGNIGTAATSTKAGSGGSGLEISWLPTEVGSTLGIGTAGSTGRFFAGGGGGGSDRDSISGGDGGSGGGGSGSTGLTIPASGIANSGGGGGGSGISGVGTGSLKGGDGGTGVVVIRYVNAPSISLSSNSIAATIGSEVSSYTISNSGGAAASYEISPSLASNGTLSFSSSTGLLSGIPSAVSTSTTYTITARNTSGTSTATFSIKATHPNCSATPVSSGGFTRWTFTTTTTCNWVVPSGVTSAEVLVVAGGGGGNRGVCAVNYGAGAGGGGVNSSTRSLTPGADITIKVGAGGSRAATNCVSYGQSGTSGENGGTSSFDNTTVNGGLAPIYTSLTGGSSGNGNIGGTIASSGTSNCGASVNNCGAGGGGGAAAVGSGLNGGAGVSSDISGTSKIYGGGGPGKNNTVSGTSGDSLYSAGSTPTANTGGGGSDWTAGADGIVIIKYALPTLTPTFGTPTATADGFTVQITNYSASYTWSGTATASGSVAISGTGLVTVTGVAPGTSSTATITNTTASYTGASATVSATSTTGSALTPTFGTPTATADGFTVQITNYSASYTWSGTATASGSVTISGTGLITVTGVAPGTSSTATITTVRTGYTNGSATISATSTTGSALNPTFGTPTATLDGFTVQITNYSASYTWSTPTVSRGTVSVGTPSGSNLLLTVSGLNPGQSATITQNTTRAGYNNGTATVTATAIASCAPSESISGGFTVLQFTTATTCSWTAPSGVSAAEILVVGGGGGGGADGGGGGGGGGVYQNNNFSLVPGSAVAVKVGAGGNGGNGYKDGSGNCTNSFATWSSTVVGCDGSSGESSSLGTVSASGGGGGGGIESSGLADSNSSANSRGGGGGAGAQNSKSGRGSAGVGGYTGGSVTDAAGNAAGGGAGAGANGSASSGTLAGAGGAGVTAAINSIIYGSGGGGGSYNNATAALGGANAANGGSQTAGPTSPVANRGGGGGGGGNGGTQINAVGSNGAAGVVIIRYVSTYTVTYNYNSADAGNSTASSTFAPGGTALTLPTPTRTGFAFSGWYTAPSGGTLVGAGGASYTPNGANPAITLEAQWVAPSGTVNVPSAPDSVTATSVNGVIQLTWLAPKTLSGKTITNYQVEYSTTGAVNSWVIASSSIASNATTYNITGLTANTSYYVRIAALFSGGRGAYGYPWQKVYGTVTSTRNGSRLITYQSGFGTTAGDAFSKISAYTRVRYLMKATYGGNDNFADVDFIDVLQNPSTSTTSGFSFGDINYLRIPSTATGQQFVAQGDVYDLTVLAPTTVSVQNGFGFNGRVEIWPWDYGVAPTSGVSTRAPGTYDDGDSLTPGSGWYGSFQLHNLTNGASDYRQTIFAWNNHQGTPEIGFGNQVGGSGHTDWTFCSSNGTCGSRTNFSLEIYVNSPLLVTTYSSDSALSSVILSSGTLSPTFTSGTFSYTASVTNATTSLTVTPTRNQANSTIAVNGLAVTSGSASGSIALNVGSNTVSIVVTAQDGITTSTYTITINRAGSNIATLSALTISSGTLSPNFSTGTTSYTASVANSIATGFTVTTTVTQANATTVQYLGSTGTTLFTGALSVGANVIRVVVTAQDGTTTSTYTITVTRAAQAFTITYNAGTGGSGSAPSTPTSVNDGATFTTPVNTYTRDGYSFAGWNDGTNTYEAGATYPASGSVNANVTLTATWTAVTCSPTSSNSGGYSIYTFTSTGTCLWSVPNGVTNVEILAVAGGGGGGYAWDNAGAGGGAGGQVKTGTATLSTTLEVTVGAGGSAGSTSARQGGSGGNSIVGSITALGGGGGCAARATTCANSAQATSLAAANGGAGGAGGASGKGGGGSSTSGSVTSSTVGGAGTASSYSGSPVTYGVGGAGGTARAALTNIAGSSGTANTGNGGGGASAKNSSGDVNGGAGGSGLVVIRVASALTVSFDSQGGSSVSDTSTVTAGIISSAPTAPTRSNYTFLGWFTAASGGSAIVFPYSHGQNANFTLYAQWALNTYAITFNANNGSGTMGNQSFTHGVATTLNANLYSRANYVFYRWATNADGSGTTYSNLAQVTLTAGTTLYAQWTANTYVVTFNYNGADGGDSTPTASFTTGGSAIALPVPTRTGFTFAGWHSDAALSTAIGTGGGSGNYSPTGAVLTLNAYAKWTAVNYTFTYDANSADSGSVPTETSKQITQTAIVKANTGSLVRAGYTFSGWNTASNGTGDTYLSGSIFTIQASNVTLFAKWTANTYTITYNVNGGTGSAQKGGNNLSSDTYTTGGSSVVLPDVGTLNRTGYTFGGWNTSAAGTGTNYLEAATYTTVSNVIFYAKWNPVTYTITYDGNTSDGGSTPTQGGYTTGQSSPYVVQSNLFTKTSNVFGGWNTAANGSGTSYSPGASITTLSNITLYAVWIPQFTLHYAINGGTVNAGSTLPADTLYNINTSVTTFSALSRTGYTFDGWTNGSSTISPGGSFNIVQDSVLTAKWTPINYTISYNSDGGTEVATQTPKQIGQSFTVASAPSKPGYNFTGWSHNSNIVGADAVVVMGSSNISYTAQWVAKIYTISYDWNGGRGTAVPDVNYTFGTTAITLPLVGDRVKDGYTFAGWSESSNGSLLSATYTPSQSRTLYAIWNVGNFTVNYNTAGGTLANTSVSVQNGSSTVLPLPTRANFVFDGWHTATVGGSSVGLNGASFIPAASQTVYARWIQASLYGITDSLTRIGSVVTVANVANTFSGANSSSSVIVSVPANALPAGTTINFDMVGNSSRATGLLQNINYLISIAVSWIAGDGTVPNTSSGNPISVTISNATIKAGAAAYAIVNNVSTLLGTATQDGTITIELTSDPEVVVAAVRPDAPTNVSASSNGNQSSVISWSAPSSNGGSAITGYTVTATPGGGTCTTSTTSCTISSLANGTSYSFTVIATNNVGNSVASSPASATTAALYAVTFNSKGGSSVTSGSFLTASTVSEPTAPTRTGYSFAGWSATDGGSAITFPYAPGVTTAITLYARWDALDNAVTFDSKGGSDVTAGVFSSGGTVAEPTAPTRTGYTFAGWSATDGGSAVTFPYAPGVVTDITLYAKWTVVSQNNSGGNGNSGNNNSGNSNAGGNSGNSNAGGNGNSSSQAGVSNPGRGNVTTVAPVTVVGDTSTKVPTVEIAKPATGSDSKPPVVKVDKASEKIIAEVKVVEGKLELTPETGFSGKKTVTVTITENGEDRVVQIPLTVLPEPVTKPVLTPTASNKSIIRWSESPNADAYTVYLNGKKVCSTSALSCSIKSVLGPDANVEIVSNGGDRTVSQRVEPEFRQIAPVVVTRVVSATITKAALTRVDTRALDKVIALIRTQGFSTVVISEITTTSKTKALAEARIAAIKKYIDDKTGSMEINFEIVPASTRTYFNNIAVKG